MPKSFWMPTDDPGKRDWLIHFAGEIPAHAATIGVIPAEVTSVQNDAAYFDYLLRSQTAYSDAAQQWTAFKNKARNGTGTTMGPLPTAPTLGAAPDAVLPGIFTRLAALVARVKKHPGYAIAIGQALDIIGAEQTVDTTGAKPVLKLELHAGHPNVKWKKGSFDSVELWVDRADGKGFVFLDIDTAPDYLDNSPLPAPGQTALWKYKGIYRLHDQRVGEWSDVVEIVVRG